MRRRLRRPRRSSCRCPPPLGARAPRRARVAVDELRHRSEFDVTTNDRRRLRCHGTTLHLPHVPMPNPALGASSPHKPHPKAPSLAVARRSRPRPASSNLAERRGRARGARRRARRAPRRLRRRGAGLYRVRRDCHLVSVRLLPGTGEGQRKPPLRQGVSACRSTRSWRSDFDVVASSKLPATTVNQIADRVLVEGLEIHRINPCIYGICIDYFTEKLPSSRSTRRRSSRSGRSSRTASSSGISSTSAFGVPELEAQGLVPGFEG